MRIAIAEDENAYAEKLREYLRQYLSFSCLE